jgi:hypothetical protein
MVVKGLNGLGKFCSREYSIGTTGRAGQSQADRRSGGDRNRTALPKRNFCGTRRKGDRQLPFIHIPTDRRRRSRSGDDYAGFSQDSLTEHHKVGIVLKPGAKYSGRRRQPKFTIPFLQPPVSRQKAQGVKHRVTNDRYLTNFKNIFTEFTGSSAS